MIATKITKTIGCVRATYAKINRFTPHIVKGTLQTVSLPVAVHNKNLVTIAEIFWMLMLALLSSKL